MTRTRARRGDRRTRRPHKATPQATRPAPPVDRRVRVFHWIVVAGAAATVLLTWPLWQLRTAPPMIPLLPLPAVGTGIALLAALTVAAVRPAAGLAAYALVLGYAIVTDATRLQPALVSFALLMAARLPPPRRHRDRARARLVPLVLRRVPQVAEPGFHGRHAQPVDAGGPARGRAALDAANLSGSRHRRRDRARARRRHSRHAQAGRRLGIPAAREHPSASLSARPRLEPLGVGMECGARARRVPPHRAVEEIDSRLLPRAAAVGEGRHPPSRGVSRRIAGSATEIRISPTTCTRRARRSATSVAPRNRRRAGRA